MGEKKQQEGKASDITETNRKRKGRERTTKETKIKEKKRNDTNRINTIKGTEMHEAKITQKKPREQQQRT